VGEYVAGRQEHYLGDRESSRMPRKARENVYSSRRSVRAAEGYWLGDVEAGRVEYGMVREKEKVKGR
jgi:hypothetical protein